MYDLKTRVERKQGESYTTWIINTTPLVSVIQYVIQEIGTKMLRKILNVIPTLNFFFSYTPDYIQQSE